MALPKDYKVPEKGGAYMKFKQGENRFRMMSDIITGNSYWTKDEEGKSKPVRKREGENIQVGEIDGRLSHFWAMVVWDYSEEAIQKSLENGDIKKSIKILEITQNTIQKAIATYERNKDYGNSNDFDITVTRAGEQLETTYTVMPSPPKTVAPDITTAFKEAKINLDALYSTTENPNGGDPFADATQEVKPDDVPTDFKPEDLPF